MFASALAVAQIHVGRVIAGKPLLAKSLRRIAIGIGLRFDVPRESVRARFLRCRHLAAADRLLIHRLNVDHRFADARSVNRREFDVDAKLGPLRSFARRHGHVEKLGVAAVERRADAQQFAEIERIEIGFLNEFDELAHAHEAAEKRAADAHDLAAHFLGERLAQFRARADHADIQNDID